MEALTELLATPDMAYILLILGVYGIIFEILNPGIGAPGIFGVICLILAFVGLQSLPVDYLGIMFIFAGVILIGGEAFIPSFGVLSICGTISFALGGYHLVPRDALNIGVSIWLIALISIINLIVIYAIMALYVKTKRSPVTTGIEGIKDSRGTIISWNNNKGVVYAAGSEWNASSAQTQNWKKGDYVSVKDIDGLKLIVENYNQPQKGE